MNELGKLLRHFPDKPWNWSWLSSNPAITMNDVNTVFRKTLALARVK